MVEQEVEPVTLWTQVQHKTFGWHGVVEFITPLYVLITFQDGGQQWCLREALEIVSASSGWAPFAAMDFDSGV